MVEPGDRLVAVGGEGLRRTGGRGSGGVAPRAW